MADPFRTRNLITWLSLLAVLGIIMSFSVLGIVNKTLPWHPASQVRLNSTAQPLGNYTPDDNVNGKVDWVDCADSAGFANRGLMYCLNKRGPLVTTNSTVWCRNDYPKMMGCQIVANATATHASTIGHCLGDGACPLTNSSIVFGPRRTFSANTVYLERVLKNSSRQEGCFASSGNWAGGQYRLDIACCKATFIGDASPSLCGNGVINAGEECDGSNLNGQTCQTIGWDGGTLSCVPGTCQFNESACTSSSGGGGGGGSCFAGETLVVTPRGSVPIAELREGGTVVSFDEASGVLTTARVTLYREYDRDEYYLLNGALRVTPEHRFARVLHDGIVWVTVAELHVGETVRTIDGDEFTISSIKYRNEPILVYNPALGAPHTYFVLVDGQAVLVHNMKCQCCGDCKA